MSLYGKKLKIGGLVCGLVLRGPSNGHYTAVFEREFASLEQLEAIDWSRPKIEGECILPAGYGFERTGIRYVDSNKTWEVELRVAEQYLGDVTGYVAQVKELEQTVAAKTAALQEATDLIQGMVDAEVEGIMSGIGGENDDV